MFDEGQINKNIKELHTYFDGALDKYFENGNPIPRHFEETVCYNCGSSDISNSFIVNRFNHVRCKNCQMVYANPRFKESIAENLYNEDEYTEFYKIKLIPSIDYRKTVLAENKYNQISRYFDKPGKALDIGSGLGEVLGVFNEHGWDCLGIEFNEFAANFAKEKFGVNVINKNIYDFNSTQKFDLIMLWGVLEHFFKPLDILNKVYELLEDDGLLVLEVPSADSVLVRYCEKTSMNVDRIIEGDRHLMLFSLRSFIEMTSKADFSAIEVKSNGLDISTLNRLELDNILTLSQVNEIQQLLDDSGQSDLLRGFFKKVV